MAKPDTSNAHVRGRHNRGRARPQTPPEQEAADAKRLLEDPAFRKAYDGLRNELVRCISELRHDGSPEAEAYEREMCRSLRNLHNLRHYISKGPQLVELNARQKGFTDDAA